MDAKVAWNKGNVSVIWEILSITATRRTEGYG